ncbi:MAG: putative DNA-binding domain-containing protein [Bdellovibrionales bacterium]
MQLADIQHRFKDLMLDHPDALNSPPDDLASVFESGDIALPARLKVYRNNIVGSLTDIMAAGFPALEKLVGKDFFETAARSFILKNPPQSGCLTFYGQGFAEFLAAFAPAASLPYLPDIARLEIALNDSYYAADDRPLRAEDLAAIAPEDLGNTVLALRDSVKLLQSPYPVCAIYDFALADDPQGTLDINSGGESVMVSRPHLETQIAPLAHDEFVMLSALAQSIPLGEAAANVLGRYPDFDFQAFLQKHLSLETFVILGANK